MTTATEEARAHARFLADRAGAKPTKKIDIVRGQKWLDPDTGIVWTVVRKGVGIRAFILIDLKTGRNAQYSASWIVANMELV